MKNKITISLILVDIAVWFLIIGLGRLLLYLPDPAYHVIAESTEYLAYVFILGGVLMIISTLEPEKYTKFDWALSGAAGGLALAVSIGQGWVVEEVTPGIFKVGALSPVWWSVMLLVGVYVIFVLVKCARQMLRNKHRTRDKRRRLYFNTLLVCLTAIVPAGFAFYGITTNQWLFPLDPATTSIFILIAAGCMAVGFLIVTGVVGLMGVNTFLPSLDVLGLYLINDNGVPMFTHKFKDRPGEQDEELLSSAINAMSTFFKEYTGAKSGIQEMCFKDLFFQCEFMPAREELKLPAYTCLLLTEGKIKFVTKALDRFVKQFDAQFQDALRLFKGDQNLFEGATNLVKESFYFVR